MQYKLIRQKRKSIRVYFEGADITVKAPYCLDTKKVDEVVKKFTLKYGGVKTAIEENKDSIYILGEKFLQSSYKYDFSDYNNIKKLFENYREFLLGKINDFCATTSTRYKKVVFKKFRSRWGCLNTDGIVSLNYLIFMLPESLIDYIILHELCHFKHFNHSKDFWNCLFGYLPDYKMRKKQLKSFDYLLNVYK